MQHLLLFIIYLQVIQQCVVCKIGEGNDLPPDGDLQVGIKKRAKDCPQKVNRGDRVSTIYSSYLYRDKSLVTDRHRYDFTLGSTAGVIRGLVEGIRGMCVGEHRRLTIPSGLAYGSMGNETLVIPPNATIVIDIELVAIGDDTIDDSCGLYYAPSSIPNGGFGIFAGKKYAKDEMIELSTTMPIFDLEIHHANYRELNQSPFGVLGEYYWGATSSELMFEASEVHVLGGDLQSFVNTHPFHNNIQQGKQVQQVLYDRNVDPGAGAYNNYFMEILATRDIEEGEELFISYGDEFGSTREGDSFGEVFHLKKHYEAAEEILSVLVKYISSILKNLGHDIPVFGIVKEILQTRRYSGINLLPHDDTFYGNLAEPDKRISYWDFLKDHCALDGSACGTHIADSTCPTQGELNLDGVHYLRRYYHDFFLPISNVYEVVVDFKYRINKSLSFEERKGLFFECIKQVVSELVDFKVSKLMPQSMSELNAMRDGGVTALTLNKRVRDRKSLSRDGFCLNKVRVDTSTVNQAGAGIFAKRNIRKGEIIFPAPLLHVRAKNLFEMGGWEYVGEDNDDDGSDYDDVTFQPLLNYCFEHEESTILLCLLSTAGQINHQPACNEKGKCANADYMWSTLWDSMTNNTLSRSLHELKMLNRRSLSMDFVALRDIDEGEEIFIDYGSRWEEAWSKYLEEWEAPQGIFANFTSPSLMEEEYKKEPRLLTVYEQHLTPYPPNIMTSCPCFEEEFHFTEDAEREWESVLNDMELLDQYIFKHGVNMREFFVVEASAEVFFCPCNIIKRKLKRSKIDEQVSFIYDARIYQLPGHQSEASASHVPRVPRFVTDLEPENILFMNRPYSSDFFLPGAFRHPISIKDDIFPSHWKDLSDSMKSLV